MDSSSEDFKNTVHRRQQWPETPRPALCRRGCGFYGTEANGGLCSKCYKEEKSSATHVSDSLDVGLIIPPFNPFPCFQALARKRKRAADPDDHDHDRDGGDDVKSPPLVVKKRCKNCSKRIGVTGFECRCGELFCATHRYPEAHACTFDFKTAGRLALIKDNPVCKGDKLKDRL